MPMSPLHKFSDWWFVVSLALSGIKTMPMHAHCDPVIQPFLSQHNITAMQWPTLSPDLNPIGNLWGFLKRQIRQLLHRLWDAAALRRVIRRRWNQLPRAYLVRPSNSMKNRVNRTINTARSHIRY